MKRKRRIVAVVLIAPLLLLIFSRPFQARSYMQRQIERLAREGYTGYVVYKVNYLTFSDYAHFPCITIRARRVEKPKGGVGDGYHYIEVDFPWIPLRTPEHRI
jgi:hypothetical protein